MTQPVPAGDARSRALRTLGQNLLIDVGLAVLVVALPLISSETIAWSLVLASVGRTALATAVAYLHRTLDAYRTAQR
ncbi:hypothetical protein [Crossiella sp. CA198]|uniref:hypothetical protein n=1 Tax=Crossiella sp. CA198 TaxID=3455607 RepID=UPI003F8CFA2D